MSGGFDSATGWKSYTPELKISVGISAYNERANIGKLLDCLLAQIGEHDEIIVVASGCSDGTSDLVRKCSDDDKRVRLFAEQHRNGKASALNLILSKCSLDMILLVSADVIPQEGSAKAMVSLMKSDQSIGMVCSRPIPQNSHDGVTGQLAHLYWRLHHHTLTILDKDGTNTQGGEAILLRRGIVSQLPLDCINDDAYIGVETVRKGLKVKYCPEARVKMKAPERISELISQRRRIIQGHLRVRRHTGIYPNVLSTLILRNPPKALKILSVELGENLFSIPALVVGLYVEAVSGCLAMIDTVVGRDHTRWNMASSTKVLE